MTVWKEISLTAPTVEKLSTSANGSNSDVDDWGLISVQRINMFSLTEQACLTVAG